MTIFLEEPRNPVAPTIAGGVGELGDIAGAAFDSLKFVENVNAAYAALDQAYEERIAAIHSATGAMLEHPLRAAEEERRRLQTEAPRSPLNPEGERDWRAMAEERLRAFDGELFSLGEKFPLARTAIGADRPLTEDAERIARQADERLATLMASREGLSKWAAVLAGGAAASFRDPVAVASIFAGGGPGAARTIAGRLLTVAGKEMLINGATEAAVQPMVQAWREKAGLSHGLDEVVRNVLFASVLGGAFGIAGQGVAEAARPFIRAKDVERAAAAVPRDRLAEPGRAILEDDGLAAAGSLAEIREALRPEARGALDEAARIIDTDAQRPAGIAPDVHDRAVARADQALADIESWPGFDPDPAQIERVTTEIYGGSSASRAAGAPAGRAKGRGGRSALRASREEQSLVEFLQARGGVLDQRGELKAIGGEKLSRRRKGRDRRLPLDMAREAAEEAGYIGRAGETQVTSVADLLDAIDRDLRGEKVFARGAETGGGVLDEAGRARLEGVVAEIARHAGPGADDATITRAARLAIDEGMEPFDAVETVFLRMEDAAPATAGRTGEPLPGWGDEDLLAASEQRGAEPVPDGLDDPGRVDAEDLDMRDLDDFADDELIPSDDGSLMRVRDLRARLDQLDTMAAVVAACRA